MKQYFKQLLTGTIVFSLISVTVCGCGATRSSKSSLNPKNPITVTVWNYYNGDQLAAFDQLVEDFNASIGTEKGVVVVSVSQGDIATLAEAVIDSAEGKAGAQDLPTLASVYAETAYILEQKDMLVPINTYFSKEELSTYVPAFLEEGRFNEKNELLQFPISKSTEVFTVNETDWDVFSNATGVKLDSVKTQEDLVDVAAKYYEWTDSLTPDILEDGKALYGRDSVANYLLVGSYQLGHEIFPVKDGKVHVDIDKETFKTLWDNYYIPFINGYFGAYAKFRSEDIKTGKIIALTSSSSSMGYLPTQVTLEDDSTYDVTMFTEKSLPFANAVNKGVVQQGASFCLLKTSDAQQEGAVEFLKWFTEPDRNMKFSLLSGYSPVTLNANTEEAITSAYSGDITTSKGQNVLKALTISADVFANDAPYATKPFAGSKEARSVLEKELEDISINDRAAVVEAIAAGATREEAVAEYSSDAYFDAWYQKVCEDISNVVEK